MAKVWTPSKKAISRYDELVRQNNEIRTALIKRRKKYEGMGGLSSLPDLVIPMERKPIGSRMNYKKYYRELRQKEFWSKMRELSRLVTGGLEGWYKRNYKQAILQAWRDALDKQGYAPDTFGGHMFSKEYMEQYPDYAKYFEAYNRLFRLPIGTFMDMYDRHLFPEFKYIYLEMLGKFGGEAELSPIEEALDSLKNWRKISTSNLNDEETKENEVVTSDSNAMIKKQQERLKKSKERAKARNENS